MSPETITAMITAIANAVTEVCRFLQTEQGQESLKRAAADRTAFEKGMRDVGGWFQRLITGELVQSRPAREN